MTIYVPLLVCLIGLLIYFATKPANAELKAVGKDMFWTGLLVTLFQLAGHQLTLPPR